MYSPDPDAPPVAGLPRLCPDAVANVPANTYTFGDKNGKPDGSMSVKLQAGKGDVRFSVKSKAIDLNGAPYSGTDLSMSWSYRVTVDDCGAAFDTDCTIVDAPWPVGLACTNGSCVSAAPTWNAILPGSIHEGALNNIEMGQIEVIDQDGDDVFRTGLLVQ